MRHTVTSERLNLGRQAQVKTLKMLRIIRVFRVFRFSSALARVALMPLALTQCFNDGAERKCMSLILTNILLDSVRF